MANPFQDILDYFSPPDAAGELEETAGRVPSAPPANPSDPLGPTGEPADPSYQVAAGRGQGHNSWNIYDALYGKSDVRKRQEDAWGRADAQAAAGAKQRAAEQKATLDIVNRVRELKEQMPDAEPHVIRGMMLKDPSFQKNILASGGPDKIMKIMKDTLEFISRPAPEKGAVLSPGQVQPFYDPVTKQPIQGAGMANPPTKVQEDDVWAKRPQHERDIVLTGRPQKGVKQGAGTLKERAGLMALESGMITRPEYIDFLMDRSMIQADTVNGGHNIIDRVTKQVIRRLDPSMEPPNFSEMLRENPGISGTPLPGQQPGQPTPPPPNEPRRQSDPRKPDQEPWDPNEAPTKRIGQLERPGMMIYGATPQDTIVRGIGNVLGIFPRFSEVGTQEEVRASALKTLNQVIARGQGGSARFKSQWEEFKSMTADVNAWTGSPAINAHRLSFMRAKAADALEIAQAEVNRLSKGGAGSRTQFNEAMKEAQLQLDFLRALPTEKQIKEELDLWKSNHPSVPSPQNLVGGAPSVGEAAKDIGKEISGAAKAGPPPKAAPQPRGAPPAPAQTPAQPAAEAPALKPTEFKWPDDLKKAEAQVTAEWERIKASGDQAAIEQFKAEYTRRRKMLGGK